MDYLWIILGIIFFAGGVLGCFLPVLPGPQLAYISLLLLQFTEKKPFTAKFLVIWAILVFLITLLDYLMPSWTTRKMGGSQSGVRGSILGVVLGLFILPPLE